MIGFLVLAAGTDALDRRDLPWLAPVRRLLETHVFTDPKATSDLLGTIAGGVSTMTSVTISVLLRALQQAAGSMTTQALNSRSTGSRRRPGCPIPR